ncbi:HIRA-interacting protein, putative [Perkinsus marinus ATCC 50983]|uniref:HIRA-interacting protein, putative n=1 Tax=Perkinsus marinus (strain ATCC 50983 / TXsc) TaxID=423536 RepID=C5L2B5_PERM5|nr:HIRA-interacting protein, putative [Perkinsus marinus ATCC 50983]EER09127.1 HIRA-interacting protein, putative [Perkinsus marinus ATCC 50983]|eukprot:XP_002777311.1 HIRA-interacting protein, putative [Perkinsus marinus ATCC 50983]
MFTSAAFKFMEFSSGARRSATYTTESSFCPRVAKELLEVKGVDKVTVGDGFLSIIASRPSGREFAFAEEQLAAFKSILDKAAVEPENYLSGDSTVTERAPSSSSNEVEERIQSLLDTRVRPVIAQDGGDCEFISFDSQTGRVTLALHGSCEGCPQSVKTLKDSIERTLKFYVEEVSSVEQADKEEGQVESPYIYHKHVGTRMTEEEKEELAAVTPLFSTFAGATINERMISRIHFCSTVQLSKEQAASPDTQVVINCEECGTHRNVEHVDDLLVNGPKSCGKAALVICPSCITILETKS